MRFNGDNAVARKQRRRREICQSFTCISPWFIFCRWLNRGKSRDPNNKFFERKWEENEKIDANIKPGIEISSSRINVSGIGKEASFNIGVGFGLIYLVRNELNKMIELRQRIELLLQNFHTEMENQDKQPHFMPSRTSIHSSSFVKTGVQQTPYAGEEHDEIGFSSGQFRRGERSMRMDQLEAELKAEFDHLQLQMYGSEFLLNYSQQQYPDQEYRDEEEEYAVPEMNESSNNGVCPIHLERKLHEVLEARQQERINELESALLYLKQRLDEKERELSCWKDIARFISQHFPTIPTLLNKHAMKMEPQVHHNSIIYKYNIQAT